MPIVTSQSSTLLSFSIFRMPTTSKINLMMSDGFWSFLSSLRSLGLMELTARSASSTNGCAFARSFSAYDVRRGAAGVLSSLERVQLADIDF